MNPIPPFSYFDDEEDDAPFPEGLEPVEIEERLVTLGKRIETEPVSKLRHEGQGSLPEWRGADVIVTSDPLFEPEDFVEATKLVVRTVHAKPLTWLFMEIWDAFTGHLDFTNKHGFYGELAYAALDVLAREQPDPDCRKLLKAVLARAFDLLGHLQKHHNLPLQSALVLHGMNAEGQQSRIDAATGEPTA
jgi:hypothetical protein